MGPKRVGVVATCAFLLVAGAALARKSGQTGASGLQGSICNNCHQGGTAPVVLLEGPNALDAGAQATYVFRVQTDAAITGMNAAASEGVVDGISDGGGTKTLFGEAVHADAQAPGDGGEAVYRFSFVAPQYGGPVTIFAAGNACNNNEGSDGDKAAGTSLAVAINGPPKPVPEASTPPPPPPPVDSGSDTGADAGAPVSAEDDSGCAVQMLGRSDASMLGAATAIVALGFSVRRIRRRRSRATRS